MIHHYFFAFYRTKVEPKIEPNSQKECTLFASSKKKKKMKMFPLFRWTASFWTMAPTKSAKEVCVKKTKNFEKLMLKNEKDANNWFRTERAKFILESLVGWAMFIELRFFLKTTPTLTNRILFRTFESKVKLFKWGIDQYFFIH